MITLKTTTQKTIPHGRGTRNEFIYLTIERLEIDINNVIPIGYYYFIDENESVIKLDDVSKSPKLWEDVSLAELGMLDELGSNVHLKENLIQRLTELTFYQLETEAYSNFGTGAEHWEIFVP